MENMKELETWKTRMEEIRAQNGGKVRIRDRETMVELGEWMKRSGLRHRERAEALGIGLHQASYLWDRFRQLTREKEPPEKVSFRPIHLTAEKGSSSGERFSLKVPGGFVLECEKVATAVELIRALTVS